MKKHTTYRPTCLLVSVAGLLWSAANAGETPATESSEGVNIAQVATASASFVSGDTSVAALNDGVDPGNSRDNNSGSYGNWNRTDTQWVQYDWSQPISTRRIEVYWWADGAGVHLPKACRVTYWNGTAFVPVSKPSGLGVAGDTYNTTTFDEVTTTKLRLEIDAADRASTGILEWKVEDSGKSPKFPPTVLAGIERVVMLGGKTWLNAKAKGLPAKALPNLTWSKVSGPGNVTFDNPAAAVTSAMFSATGAYVLKLTATDGGLSSSDTVKVKVMERPPVVQLDAVNTKTFKINSPLWNSRIKALVVNWIPHCISECNNHQLSQGGIDNFEEAAKAFKGDYVAQKAEYRRVMKSHHVSPWAKSLTLLVQAVVLVLLYQVFVGGINNDRVVKTLYPSIDYPGKLNSIFYGFSIGKTHDLIWPGICALYLFVSIYISHRKKKKDWNGSEVTYLLIFPLFTFTFLPLFNLMYSPSFFHHCSPAPP